MICDPDQTNPDNSQPQRSNPAKFDSICTSKFQNMLKAIKDNKRWGKDDNIKSEMHKLHCELDIILNLIALESTFSCLFCNRHVNKIKYL